MEIHLTKQQRGPTVNLFGSVIRLGKNSEEKTSAPINVGDVAIVEVKLKATGTENLQVSIRVKSNDKAKNSAVVNITCGEFNRFILCTDQWIEATIMNGNCSDYVNYVGRDGCYHPAFLYNFTLNITVDHTMTPLLPNSNLHTDREFTDFQLYTADGSVPVHKAMLFIHSVMFRTMLSGEWKETTEGRINIDGVTVQTLQHLKDYMYLGTLPDEGLEPLLLIAARYLMDKLKADCIAKLVKTIKPENFDGLVELACQNNIPELMKALVLQIPDDVVNGIHELKIKNESNESNDTNDKE